MKQKNVIANSGSQTSALDQRQGSLLGEPSTEDQLDKLCFNDVSLNNKSQGKTAGSTKKQPVKPVLPPSSVRKSLNITEEALAIGKIPPEDVARMIA
jgi:hypothetical protein